MATTQQLELREITDDEAAFFKDHGWVKFDQLISTEAAGVLLARLKQVMGDDATNAAHPISTKEQNKYFHTYEPLAVDLGTGASVDDVFYSISHSPSVGRLGAKLIGAPVRYWVDGALVKMPQAASATGAGPTNWHTDIGAVETSPFDPPDGQMQLWIALKDIPPQRGTMRFVAPKDQDDEVRRITAEYGSDPESSYPLLEAKGVLSPPLDMKAGDATIHSSGTLHSAPPNTSDEPRWVYIVSLFPAAAHYSGNTHWALDQVEGMRPGGAFDDERFPVLA